MTTRSYLSSAFLSSLVGLSLTLTLGRLPPSLSPGVLWYSTRLALTLLLLAPRCLTAAETGLLCCSRNQRCHQPHGGYGIDTRRATHVPERTGNCGHQRSPTGIGNGLRSGHVQVDPLRETCF